MFGMATLLRLSVPFVFGSRSIFGQKTEFVGNITEKH